MSAPDDRLKPARGCLNGLAFASLFWLVLAVIVFLIIMGMV